MKKINIFTLVFLLAISIVVNAWLFFGKTTQNNPEKNPSELEKQYPFLSKRILLSLDRDIIINFVPLNEKLQQLVEKEYGSDFSFYFEYLATGTSIGINEKIEFYSASLLKLPTVMAYYHMKEKKNINSDPEVIIQQSDLDNHFGNLWKRGAGSKIKLSEVAKLALTESDNTAINVLLRNIEQEDLIDIYAGLDILVTKNENNNRISITTKSYSSILKALFFSAVLSPQNSERILEFLSKTMFLDKLPAGVPENIPVAHKISAYENVSVPVYADCGIVYVPKRQYLLCMASRSDEKTAIERMKTVSKIIYEYVSTVNPRP